MKKLTEGEIVQLYDRPWLFYGLSTVGTWAFWLLAAKFSHYSSINQSYAALTTLLLILGLLFPFGAAWWLVWPKPILRADLRERIFRFDRRDIKYSLLAIATMLASIVIAQLISLLFGYSADQFHFAKGASFQAGIASGWLALIIAPIVEELSWHSYGTDTLRRSFNLFWTSIIFAVYWVLWHAPLSMVEGYYQAEVVETGWLFTLNLAISFFPFVLLMNWFYYQSQRSIIVAIVFHMSAGFFNEMFQTDPMSKVIQTGLLILLVIILIKRNPAMFFTPSTRVIDTPTPNALGLKQ